ncbi:hypothetical protein NPIL_627331 [Nephila pilipes]|uniref:Uncharacterized protein n=1 Tax=Nephila pilipes TaxID=299642 RepID=A0A8X6N6B4_NEPPI|nr:hypothetical protein NPIL_627331 [Nephila pilipes]
MKRSFHRNKHDGKISAWDRYLDRLPRQSLSSVASLEVGGGSVCLGSFPLINNIHYGNKRKIFNFGLQLSHRFEKPPLIEGFLFVHEVLLRRHRHYCLVDEDGLEKNHIPFFRHVSSFFIEWCVGNPVCVLTFESK